MTRAEIARRMLQMPVPYCYHWTPQQDRELLSFIAAGASEDAIVLHMDQHRPGITYDLCMDRFNRLRRMYQMPEPRTPRRAP